MHRRLFVHGDRHSEAAARRAIGIPLHVEIVYVLHCTGPVDEGRLEWLLAPSPFHPSLRNESSLTGRVIEIGAHPWQTSAFCSNALSVLQSAGERGVESIERRRRYSVPEDIHHDDHQLLALLGDPMTESLFSGSEGEGVHRARAPWEVIDVLGDPLALERASVSLGLAFDSSDVSFYNDLFVRRLGRNPTDVELSDLANSNSEHSRHWFFRGQLFPEGATEPLPHSLMHIIKESLNHSNPNNLIAFSDNSSCISGLGPVSVVSPVDSSIASALLPLQKQRHLVYTAETHNFPTAVCPFEGASTGTGGRIRDNHSTGRGAHEIAAVAGYSFGNLHLPGYVQPWEEEAEYPPSFAHPRHVAVEASNGASDYGNKFGEPVICGFARSFGMRIGQSRVEYLKPIMFSGGIGSIDEECIKKEPCKPGMRVAKIGGPAYRIGVGGGAASSVAVQGGVMDFSAVQRGDAGAGQKLRRAVRAAAEHSSNPILSIHDQGAGGNGNVLKEITEPCGAVLHAKEFLLGDQSLSLKELWTAEYQENDAILLREGGVPLMEKISSRENCPLRVVGIANSSSSLVVEDYEEKEKKPVEYDLAVFDDSRTKAFHLRTAKYDMKELDVGAVEVEEALGRVLRLPSVASKRYLTSKVDRSVTGLIAQQQCVGPLQTPLADVAVVAISHLDTVGAAVSVGEQPVKMLSSVESGVETTLAECLTNLVFAPISALRDVKLSGNWMWSRSEDGERLARAVEHLCECMKAVGVAIDGGKDSLSMQAATSTETVTAPGTLVLSAYAPCTDITRVVTPDIKGDSDSVVVYVSMGGGKKGKLGGTAVAQVYSCVGRSSPRVESWPSFVSAWEGVQKWVATGRILAGHDVSDGGTLVALLEMAFAGNRAISARFKSDCGVVETLFDESPALLLQLRRGDVEELQVAVGGARVEEVAEMGEEYGPEAMVSVSFNDQPVLSRSLVELREEWEETSTRLDLMQTVPLCVQQATEARKRTRSISYSAPFDFSIVPRPLGEGPRVLILREEGSNGDREMAAAFLLAGFVPFDVTSSDLLDSPALLHFARGIAFVGGFSFSDVLGSAKGWAARIKYHHRLADEMEVFRQRKDTFSLGVCNGCQLMALLGWIGEIEGAPSVFLDNNLSGKFDTSFTSLRIQKSNSILLKGMEDAVLGVWSAHGEGRFTFRDDASRSALAGNVVAHYVDETNQPTEEYPWNPNGSVDGVAAMVSSDGRHLGMMPHCDRSFLSWQWPLPLPSSPSSSSPSTPPSPWMRLFNNAYQWVADN